MQALVMVLLAAIVCVILGRVLEMVLAEMIGWWQNQDATHRPGSRSGLSGDV